MNAIDFGAAPATGFTVQWGGQSYTVTSAVNVTLRGVQAVSIKWATVCPDCAKPWAFETGGRRRYMPKRCPSCNGPDDKDAQERKAFARVAWAAGVAAARERKAQGGVERLEASTLNRLDMLECEAILKNGERVALRWAPGYDLSDEAPAIRKALPLLAAEHARLLTQRILS